MWNRIIKVLLAVVTSTVMISCNYTQTGTEDTITNTVDTMTNNSEADKQQIDHDRYIDMNTVISYSGTETGLLLNMADGTGYYLEIPQETAE